MPKRNRLKRPGRSQPSQEPKPLILVVTEGSITEPEYLKAFVRACHNPRVEVEIKGGQGVPKTIVDFAKQQKKAAEKQATREGDDNLMYDAVWCVFDIDDHPNISEAKQFAHDSGIELAISNPCVELWLLLHFVEPPGAQHRDVFLTRIAQHIANYNKHVDFTDYAVGYDLAVKNLSENRHNADNAVLISASKEGFRIGSKRARQLDELAAKVGEPGRNPTTGIWRLTEDIRQSS